MKKFCKEVTPQPIANSYFYKIPKGKFKGKYLYYDMGGMFAMPSSLTLGWEVDGGYVFPKMFKHEFANNGGPETYDFSQITNDMSTTWVFFFFFHSIILAWGNLPFTCCVIFTGRMELGRGVLSSVDSMSVTLPLLSKSSL